MTARRVIVLHQGRIVEAGGAAEIFAVPCDPYTARLLETASRATRMSGVPAAAIQAEPAPISFSTQAR